MTEAAALGNPEPDRPARRDPGLDIVRTIAVACVALVHIGPAAAGDAAVWRLCGRFFRCGWIGVDCFFVLSGFLVSGLLFREYRRDAKCQVGRFLLRRAFKIYPAFYVFLILTTVWPGWSYGQTSPIAAMDVLGEALFLQNYVGHTWAHTWSLAVEEHFYLGLALLVWALIRRSRRGRRTDGLRVVPTIGLSLLGACLIARIVHLMLGWSPALASYATHLRCDALFYGVVLSYAVTFHRPEVDRFVSRYRLALIASVPILLAPVLIPALVPSLPATGYGWFNHTIGYTLNSIAFGNLVLLIAARPTAASTSRPTVLERALAWIGEHSYSIYIWHWLVLGVCRTALEQRLGHPASYPVFAGIGLLAAIAVGIALAKLIELPVLRLRDWIAPSPARLTAGPVALADGTSAAA